MKNKILLTLVLLIPSLCFGTSIKIVVNSIPSKEDSKDFKNFVHIVSSKPLPLPLNKKDKKYTVYFKSMGKQNPKYPMTIRGSDNIGNYLKLKTILAEFLPITREEMQFREEDMTVALALGIEIEDMFIQNGYSLTFKEEEISEGNKYTSERFFYKTDK